MLFKNLFNKKKTTIYSKTNGLSKIEYVEKHQLESLFTLLHQAEDLIQAVASTNSDIKFLKFKNIFIEEIYEVEGDNIAEFTKIWNWFKPNKEWSEFTGSKGIELGSQIFDIVATWKLDDDFIPGTKVLLNNEYGVVLDKTNHCNAGIIRWDTEKEVDVENWIGMFGTFIQIGGIIITQNYQFKFINDDGSLKNHN
ncbi:hypothetical protein [Chryseobacterium sp. GP-SGM7]|uniref:hypothetical protein n=1 Tax=Chryseobacterium sp. GP-SGM7 TaxID=3411323 RepID=UPI003B946709